MVLNVQEWLDKNYPKEERVLIKRLYINNKNLEGCLELQDFVKLEKLDCSGNQLTGLIFNGLVNLLEINCSENKLTDLYLSECSSLEKLCCSGNQLFSTEFINKLPSPEKLTYLNISSNKFSAHNLSFLSRITNLKKVIHQ